LARMEIRAAAVHVRQRCTCGSGACGADGRHSLSDATRARGANRTRGAARSLSSGGGCKRADAAMSCALLCRAILSIGWAVPYQAMSSIGWGRGRYARLRGMEAVVVTDRRLIVHEVLPHAPLQATVTTQHRDHTAP
jgi:hypothetical protein